MEVWKDIKGYEGLYQISNLGRVKSFYYGKERIIKQGFNGDGYLQIRINKDLKKKSHKVHRLVAIAFIENPENKPQVNHINGIKTDNAVENLEWCTNAENAKHAYKIGLKCSVGEKNNTSKLKEFQVLQIRNDNRSLIEIAKDYNISKSHVWSIKNKRLWSHI